MQGYIEFLKVSLAAHSSDETNWVDYNCNDGMFKDNGSQVSSPEDLKGVMLYLVSQVRTAIVKYASQITGVINGILLLKVVKTS